jgi:predicted Zn-dependent protease
MENIELNLENAPRVQMSRRGIIKGLAAGTVFPFMASASGCATNPVTGRSQLAFIGDSQLLEMSLSAWGDMKKQTPVSRDPKYTNRLKNIGEKIAVAANRPNDPWEFVVFDTPEKNAFVMPGGKVGFYRGLMDMTENDSQMAAVLGHEVGHVTGRHAAERMSQGVVAQLAMVGGQIAIAESDIRFKQEAAAALGLGIQFGVLMPYSRLHELEADKLGVDYMHASGYDVRQSIRVWELMAQDSAGKARPPEFLSTHPSPERRMDELRQYINARGYALV